MPSKDYDSCLKSLTEQIKQSEMLEENREKILEYKRDMEVQDLSSARIYKLLVYLKKIAEHIDFKFENADIEDLKDLVSWVNQRDLADSTKIDYKTIIKQFFKWMNDGEYPDCVKFIKTTRKRSNDTLPEDILNEKDIENLIDSATNSRDEALISILWETGARIGELIDLEVGDLKDHQHGKKIIIEGKTGARRLPLISSVPHLQKWLNNHPRSDESDAPLWVNLPTANNNAGKKVSYRTILKRLNITKERAEIDKPINPHHFRHSRATYLASKFTESQLCEWFGWVQGSDRPATYVHMSGRDIDGDYARLHGRESKKEKEKSELAPVDCPRCGEKNEPKASFCQNCGQSLEMDAQEKIEEGEEIADRISGQVVTKDQVREIVKDIMQGNSK